MITTFQTLHTSPAHARASPFRHDLPGLALLLQSIHADLPARFASPPDRAHVTDAFLWLFPCCEDGTRIGDSLNRMHVAGLLFCKFCHHDLYGHFPEECTPARLFPDHPRLHIVERSAWDMPLSELLTFLLAIQHDFRALVHACPDRTAHAVLACCASLAHFASSRHPPAVLDMEEHVEPGASEARQLSRKALRSTLTTIHGLLRAWVLHSLAEQITVFAAETPPPDAPSREDQPKPGASAAVLRNIRALWRKKETAGEPRDDTAWLELARALDPVSVGDAPRKRTTALDQVVAAATSLARAEEDDEAAVPGEALKAVVEAMRFYYVLPSASVFRALALQVWRCGFGAVVLALWFWRCANLKARGETARSSAPCRRC
tara:strand:- start:335 stop:1465 length:1131 start_codon:yes stop_codon:yes gene_type:complete